MPSYTPNIDLYTAQSPNGIKISILLEELGLPYRVHRIDLAKQVQKEPWFEKINPNGCVPALTDTFKDGEQINLFESGNILQYLCATYDTNYRLSFRQGSREYYEMNSWLFFANASFGPMQAQANHWLHYTPDEVQYGITRYQKETRRLYGILDQHLQSTNAEYNRYTVADIAHYTWIAGAAWAGVVINEFPTLKMWEERMEERPAVKRGRNVPEKYTTKELVLDEERTKVIEEIGRSGTRAGLNSEK